MKEVLPLMRQPVAKILTRLILYGLVALFGQLGVEQFEAGNEAAALGLAGADLLLLVVGVLIDRYHHKKDTALGATNAAMLRFPPGHVPILILCLSGAVLLAGCGGFSQSQALQLGVMRQFRAEMVAYHEKVKTQIEGDKTNALTIAWKWSLEQATTSRRW